MDNLELLKKAKEGDKEAFEEFYKENQKLVYSLLKSPSSEFCLMILLAV